MTDREHAGLDRRSVIKKSVAAGAAIWVAPALSTTASAQGSFCTPKCAYPPYNLGVDVFTYCPRGGQKWALVRVTPTGTNQCPCTSAQPKICVKPPLLWSKDGATDGIAITTPPPGGDPIPADGFVVRKASGAGSLGSGLWTSDGNLEVALGCDDRDGDTIWQICSFRLTFVFSPATGNCAPNAGAGNGLAIRQNCLTTCFDGDCPLDR